MSMSVSYTNFCGMVVSETRGGVESDYVSDPLGNTIGLMDDTGAMSDRWEYWPYGEVVSRTGTNPTSLTFLGILGYFKDVLDKLFYVRARHLRVDLARWLTVDPLWPSLRAYGYCASSPVLTSDASGRSCCKEPTPDNGCEDCWDKAEHAWTDCTIFAGLMAAGITIVCLPTCAALTGGNLLICQGICVADGLEALDLLLRVCEYRRQLTEHNCVVDQCKNVRTKCCLSVGS